jgi:hypothetical protein
MPHLVHRCMPVRRYVVALAAYGCYFLLLLLDGLTAGSVPAAGLGPAERLTLCPQIAEAPQCVQPQRVTFACDAVLKMAFPSQALPWVPCWAVCACVSCVLACMRVYVWVRACVCVR